MIRKVLLSSLFIGAVFPAFGQIEFAYTDFELINQPNGVQVRWTITAGNTCNGTRIERSTDSLHFEAVGEISGICGDSTVAVPYTYLDEAPPANQTIYYRLYLGGLGFSEIKSTFFIQPGPNKYWVSKHTMTGPRTVYFNNPNAAEIMVRVFNQSGQQVYEAETRSNFIQVPSITGKTKDIALFIQLFRDGELFAKGKI